MSLLSDIHTFLSSKTSITSLVPTGRIYRTHLPQSFDWNGTAISMVRISADPESQLSTSTGVNPVRVQIDCWSLDEDAADDAAEAVRLVLQSFRGMTGATEVLGIELDSVNWFPEPPTDGSNQWIHRTSSDYIVIHRNAVAGA